MTGSAPLIDTRTAADLVAGITAALAGNVPGWSPVDPATGAVDQSSAALTNILARFGEIVIERLNRAPDKGLLAFLDLLGASPLPPQPARVPLTFSVTAGSSTDAVVPAGTQVAAALGEGEKVPVIFETERELTAIAATLSALVGADAARDMIADHGALLAAPVPGGLRPFGGDRPNEHVLYVGHDAYLSARLDALTLGVTLAPDSPAAPDPRIVQWEIWDGASGIALTPSDGTNALRTSGTVELTSLAAVPAQVVNGVRSRWLRCRLLTPVVASDTPAQAMVREGQLPSLADLRISAAISRDALVPEAAFVNAVAVDVSRPFHPFGEQPRIGDTFYLAHRDAFGAAGAEITLDFTMAVPAGDFPDLQLRWETWDGTGWAPLGVATMAGATGGSFADGTGAFSRSGTVSFTLPRSVAPTVVNGVESCWIRAFIAAGNYGLDTRYVVDSSQASGFRLELSTLAPPLVGAVTLGWSATLPPVAPDAIVAFNNGQFAELKSTMSSGPVAPFVALPGQPPALYAAFSLPPARRTFPNRTVSLYCGVRLPPYGEVPTPLTPELSVQRAAAGDTVTHRFTLVNTSAESVTCSVSTFGGAWASVIEPAEFMLLAGRTTDLEVSVTVPAAAALPGPDASDRGFLAVHLSSDDAVHVVAFETRVGAAAARRRELRLEYWNGAAWSRLTAVDGTDRLSRPGVIEFLGPADFSPSEQFGVDGYWLRMLLETGDEPSVQLRALLPNTTFASQAVTVRNEIVGSSDASAGQRFRTVRSPVLDDQALEVREPGPPSAEELAALLAAGGGLTPVGGTSSEVWVRWLAVQDFHGSSARDRHYVLDHIAGEVRFGDGVNGRIPPRGVGNVRMARYRAGGGEGGNRAPRSIVQLRATVPYVERVTNVEPAEGGADAETTDALLVRAPRTLRHGGRAVTREDFEDLARAASPAVARAMAVPVRNLRDDPLGANLVAGAVSVIVVPRSTEPRPVPSTGLTTLVEDGLRAFSTATATLAVVGPLYVRVDVAAEIAVASLDGADDVENAVRDALSRFLHPLTGGRDGAGWDFGRQPHLSDLYAVVSDVPGVDHVRSLTITEVEDLEGVVRTGRFLVYSGSHEIALTLPADE